MQFKTQLIEKGALPGENSSDAVQPFNAFSPAGIITVSVVALLMNIIQIYEIQASR